MYVVTFAQLDILSTREGSLSKGGVHLHPPYPPGSATAKTAAQFDNINSHLPSKSGVLTKMGELKGPTPPSLLTAATSME